MILRPFLLLAHAPDSLQVRGRRGVIRCFGNSFLAFG
jgi:hypothetical protein